MSRNAISRLQFSSNNATALRDEDGLVDSLLVLILSAAGPECLLEIANGAHIGDPPFAAYDD